MTQTYIGRGEIRKIEDTIQLCKAKRIFLVTGKKSFELAGLGKKVEKMIKKIPSFRYSEFSQNPKYEDVLIGIKKVKEFSPDLIIGIGGGSVLDMAKLLSVLSGAEVNPLSIITGQEPILGRRVKLVLVPTTAGSGSECTHFAVVYLNGEKYSVVSKFLLPDYTVVDPELTYTLTKELTAITAFDALSHAIESYWSVASTGESRKYASSSIRSIVKIFDKLIIAPDEKIREIMMLASHQSGLAINITKTTAAHALSYGFTTHYNIPHGQAVMLTLPSLFSHNALAGEAELNPAISISDYKARISELCDLLMTRDANEATHKLEEMIKKSGLAYRLKSKSEDIEKEVSGLVSEVNIERLQNNPVIITEENLQDIVRRVFI